MNTPPTAPPKAATINDIARLAGVSKKTVSRIINQSPLVSPDTRDKVEALMREVGYTPDPLARALAFRRSFLIGMVYDNPTAQYIVDMQYGALDALRGSGYELVVHPCDTRSPGYVDGVRRFVQQQKLHGVILVPRASEDQALADMLDDTGCRYTRIAALALDETSSTVITHDRDGAAEAADYLLSLGHRDIALVTTVPPTSVPPDLSRRLKNAVSPCPRSASSPLATPLNRAWPRQKNCCRASRDLPPFSAAMMKWPPGFTGLRCAKASRFHVSFPSSAMTTARWPRACGRP